MITVYGIPACNTVKKARTWLDAHGIAYVFHDYKKSGIERSKLNHWMTQVSWEKLVNRAGTTWRKLSDEQKAAVIDANSAAELLQVQLSAIKRPLLEDATGTILALGFSESEYEKIFSV
ncbi:ArsC family reductase [Arundinibacter roseus]|uniref:ArsC family reductase n=1 Tax=Arundinibacter roseus TaxID=2070510 RepID=A0A4R4KLU9_9BACT|nr:ArsC family reductase [Arundinibacter roseus]TDB67956.1 ArsC family reductase [Arundinibacter roseus]